MKVVRFKSVLDTGKIKITAVVKMVDDKVSIKSSNTNLIHELKTQPMLGMGGKIVTIKDGPEWMIALPLNYRGSRFYAALEDE